MKDRLALVFTARVNELLEDRGITRTEFARMLKVKPPSVTRMLSGRSVGTDTIQKVAKTLGVKPEALLIGEPADTKPNGRRK